MAFGDTYLHDPSLFPRRIAGETLGDRRVWVDLPGGAFEICGLSPGLAACITREMPTQLPGPRPGPAPGPAPRPVLGPSDAPRLHVFRAPQSEFRQFELAGWNLDFDLEHSQRQVRAAGFACQFLIDLQASGPSGIEMACWTCHPDPEWIYGMVHNLLRMGVAYRLLQSRGLLLHSAVVSDGQQAWLAYGRSGDGKTTLSMDALNQGLKVLSDDMNAVVKHDGQWLALASPFCGDLDATRRHNGSFPLAGAFRISKASQDRILTAGSAAAVTGLSASCPYLNADPWRGDEMLAVIEQFAGEVPNGIWERTRGGPVIATMQNTQKEWAANG